MPGVVHLIFRFFHGVVYILCIVHVRITYLLHPHDLLRLRRAYLTTVPSCFPLILLLPLPFHPYIVASHHSSASSGNSHGILWLEFPLLPLQRGV